MLARRQIRLAVVEALSAIPNVLVSSPGDWPTTPGTAPEIKVRAPHEKKDGLAKSVVEFTTTTLVEIEARLQAATAEDAQDQIEDLGEQIENAVLCAPGVVQIVQQASSVDSELEVTSDGRQHLAGLRMRIAFEMFEAFDPTQIRPTEYPALQTVGIHADLIAPFDATGTYSSPAFPAAVQPAPRTSGPDGRDEGGLEITLPQ